MTFSSEYFSYASNSGENLQSYHAATFRHTSSFSAHDPKTSYPACASNRKSSKL